MFSQRSQILLFSLSRRSVFATKLSVGGNRTAEASNNEIRQTKLGFLRPLRTVYLSASAFSNYKIARHQSLVNPEKFWGEAAEKLIWKKKWTRVLDDSCSPFTRWFVDGEINVCYNAVDRHVLAGAGNQLALIHDSPLTGIQQFITYEELLRKVSLFAGVLKKHQVNYGDRVLIYLPMIPEAVYAMLACVRIGAIHSLVFGGFAAKELASRISHAKPKLVISTNCGMEPGRVINYKPMLDDALLSSNHQVPTVLIFDRKHPKFEPTLKMDGRDYDIEEEMKSVKPAECVPVKATHPLYILYTSGTTGNPKAVVRPAGAHAVVMHWSMYNIYGIRPKEVWFAASDLGWVVGHSYVCYAPLLHGNTSIIYEGKPVGTPDPGAIFRLLLQHNVASMFIAPTAIRAMKKEDPLGEFAAKYGLSRFRFLFVAGEHCDKDTLRWAVQHFKVPVLDNWWQTETGSAITSTCVGLGTTLSPPEGFAGLPVPGWNIKIIDENCREVSVNQLGQIVAKLPLPPGCFTTLWENDEKFKDTYFSQYPGYYDTMDAGFRDADGNIAVMSRTDDVINVAGHRLSAGHLEEAVAAHPAVAEAAVVGFPDPLKGHVPIGLCVLKSGVQVSHEEIQQEIRHLVRESVGAICSLHSVLIVKRLPKTRSGKTARATLAAMVAGLPYDIPVTIDDASVYPEIISLIKEKGFEASFPSTW